MLSKGHRVLTSTAIGLTAFICMLGACDREERFQENYDDVQTLNEETDVEVNTEMQ
jgi:hypothetical protein